MSYRKVYYFDLPNGFTGIVDRYATGTRCFVPIGKGGGVERAFADPEMKYDSKWYFGPRFRNITHAKFYLLSKGATLRKEMGMRS